MMDWNREIGWFGIAWCATVFGVVACCGAPGHAQPLPRDRDTQVRLAMAFVAEGGWNGVRDHAGVAHVLARRWRMMPGLREMEFGEVITSYCSVFKSRRRRARWIRSLTPDGLKPVGWPQKASWGLHRHLWRQALWRARAFLHGHLADPCRGRAIHWGSKDDKPAARMRRVWCGRTDNYYYAVARSAP